MSILDYANMAGRIAGNVANNFQQGYGIKSFTQGNVVPNFSVATGDRVPYTGIAGATAPSAIQSAAPSAGYVSNGGYVGGGGSGGNTTTQQAPDPYAQWGGQANYNNLINQFNTQRQNLLDSSNTSIEDNARDYGYSIDDTIHKLQLAQQGIDQQGMQNELAKRQGTLGVQGMVSRGLRQGGVMLAGKNATNSSATQAMSRAYGDLGRRQLSNVNNQYGSQLKDIEMKQKEQDYQRATGVNRLRDTKGSIVNSIVNSARQSLGELQNAMTGASLGDRLNIQAEIDGVRQRAIQRLQLLDSRVNAGDAIAPTTMDQRRSAALEAANLGQAPENAFNFTDQVPAQFQNTGPFSGGLPIFTMPRGSRRE